MLLQPSTPLFKKDANYKGPHIVQTYLKKEKSSKSMGRVFGSMNVRFFTLNMQTFEFYYTPKDHYSSKEIKHLDLSAVRNVVDKGFKTNSLTNKPIEWSFNFSIQFEDKLMNLFCSNDIMKRLWLHAFKHLVRLSDSKYLMPDETAVKQDPSSQAPQPAFKAHQFLEGPKTYRVPTSFSENPDQTDTNTSSNNTNNNNNQSKASKPIISNQQNKSEAQAATTTQSANPTNKYKSNQKRSNSIFMQTRVKPILQAALRSARKHIQQRKIAVNKAMPTISVINSSNYSSQIETIDDFSAPSSTANLSAAHHDGYRPDKLMRKSPSGASTKALGFASNHGPKKHEHNIFNNPRCEDHFSNAQPKNKQNDDFAHLEDDFLDQQTTLNAKPKQQMKASTFTHFDEVEDTHNQQQQQQATKQNQFSLVLKDRTGKFDRFSKRSRNPSTNQMPTVSAPKPALLSENNYDKWEIDYENIIL